MKRSLSSLLPALVIAAWASTAAAQATNAQLAISANVTGRCSAPTVTAMTAAALNTLSAANQTFPAGSIAVACTKGTMIGVSARTNANAGSVTGFDFALTDGAANYIGYNLFMTDLGGTDRQLAPQGATPVSTPWGPSGGRGSPVTINFKATMQGADVPVGTYNDTVTLDVWVN